ncbi:hypothetical protein E0H87_01530 [Acinetobacter sp. ANC 4178]|nr:hypothetical protein E0H87_01530 [Acinetobacter sp. ANC 4178]
MKYSKERIVKGLLLAPIPLLFWHFFFKFMKYKIEYSLDSTFFFHLFLGLVGYIVLYSTYCILIVPFSFILSILLNHYNFLNLLSICISSLIITTALNLFLGWGFTEEHSGEIPQEWWKIYTDIFFLITVIFIDLCYWLFLIIFKEKNVQMK